MNDLQNCLLVVEDEFVIAMDFRMQIEEMGLTVCAVAVSAEDAVAQAQKHRPAVVLMDMRLWGKKDGADAALIIHSTVGSKVIFITGSREPATIEKIKATHPFALLFKPISNRQLRETIKDAMRQ